MKYSPKLRKMATRFEAECRKEGIPFIACFHDKDLQITEYVMSIDTKHNYLSLENGEIRVDSSEDVPLEVKRVKLQNTVNLIYHFAAKLKMWAYGFNQIKEILDSTLDITSTDQRDHGIHEDLN